MEREHIFLHTFYFSETARKCRTDLILVVYLLIIAKAFAYVQLFISHLKRIFRFVFFYTRLSTFIETTICELAILYDIVSTWSCTSGYRNFAEHARYDAVFDKFMMARSVFYPCTFRDTNKFRFSEKSDIMSWKGMQARTRPDLERPIRYDRFEGVAGSYIFLDGEGWHQEG